MDLRWEVFFWMHLENNIMKTQKIILILILVLFAILTTAIKPLFPHDQLLQHIGTLGLIFWLIYDTKNNQQWSGFVGIMLFSVLHIIGARYVYSNVPYDQWFPFIFDPIATSERNHFDRFVHFSFGVLFFPFLMNWISNWGLKNILKTIFITWLIIQSMSLIYELFEWNLTLMASPEDADTYNGQQGDLWDAQKDMALAMLGSTIMAFYYYVTYKFFKK